MCVQHWEEEPLRNFSKCCQHFKLLVVRKTKRRILKKGVTEKAALPSNLQLNLPFCICPTDLSTWMFHKFMDAYIQLYRALHIFSCVTMWGIKNDAVPLSSIQFKSVIDIKVFPRILSWALLFVSCSDLQSRAQNSHSDENGRGSRRLGMSPTCLELLWRGTCWELQSAHNAKGVMASKNLAWHSPLISDSICGVVLCCWSYLRVEFESADSQVHPREALISSNGVNLYELVLPYGWAHCSVWLVVVQIESFL